MQRRDQRVIRRQLAARGRGTGIEIVMSPETYFNHDISKMFVFFGQLFGRNVYADRRKVAGRLVDLRVRLGEPFPPATALVYRRGWGRLWELPWTAVEAIDGGRIHLREGATERAEPWRPTSTGELLIREELLDKQVVDTADAKVERVNDLHFLIAHGALRLVHVDVGVRGILRRLGFLRSVDAATNWLFAYQVPDKLISWKYVQPLTADPNEKNLKLNVTMRKLSDLHPSDLADILEELDHSHRQIVLHSLDVAAAADAIEEMDDKVKLRLMEDVSETKATDIIREMEPDEAADLLEDLPDERKEQLISRIDGEARQDLEELLSHPQGTAGSIMTSAPITISESVTVGEALETVRSLAGERELIYYAYIVDAGEHLRGVVTLRELLTHPSSTSIATVMTADPITVQADADISDVIEIFKKYNFLSVPVTESDGTLKGFITIRDALDEAFPEFSES